MKNSSLEKLKDFEMPRNTARTVNGGVSTSFGDCIRTAIRDGNEWLTPSLSGNFGLNLFGN